MFHDPNDEDERAYTQDGINVLALDRNGRGLIRAQPEPRFPTVRFARPIDPPSAVWPTVFIVVVVAAAIGLALVRFTPW